MESGFPLEGPYRFDQERDLAQACADALRRAGWVVWRFSAHRSLPKQMKAWPDIVAFRRDQTLLIECKSISGSQTPDQADFEKRVWPHTGPHLHYILLFDLRQLETRWVSPLF